MDSLLSDLVIQPDELIMCGDLNIHLTKILLYSFNHLMCVALHMVYNTVAKGFNQMSAPAQTITVAFDMSKASDTIIIPTLIKKLLQTRIPDRITKFIANYIKGR